MGIIAKNIFLGIVAGGKPWELYPVLKAYAVYTNEKEKFDLPCLELFLLLLNLIISLSVG